MYCPLEIHPDRSHAGNLPPIAHIAAPSLPVVATFRSASPLRLPPVFFAKNAESLESKRVAYCVSAKKGKRVRKNVKGKGIARAHVDTSGGLNVRIRSATAPPTNTGMLDSDTDSCRSRILSAVK